MTDQNFPFDKLRALLDGDGSAYDKIQAIRDDLLPPALPDPLSLFGAWATHPDHGEGIVISHFPDKDGEVLFTLQGDDSDDGTWTLWVNPCTLTFHSPDHPEFLESEEDYRSAPEGTIVAGNDALPLVLLNDLWRGVYWEGSDHDDMAGIRRRVLRWRWEA